MSLGGYLRRNLFWAKDKVFNKNSIKSQYSDIKQILENYEDGIIKVNNYIDDLLNHATKTTNYYKKYEGKAISDFPVVNKSIFIENYDDFVSSSFKDEKLHTMSTSGSTGTPFTVLQNMSKRDRVIAELKLFGEFCGYKSHEKMVFLRVLSDKTRKSKKTQWAENIYRIDTAALNEEKLRETNEFLIKNKIEALISYASTFDYLANYIEKYESKTDKYSIKTIIAGGEAFDIKTREKLNQIFGKKCNIVSRYSNQEMGILGQDSSIDSGFVLNHGSYYFECLKIDSDEPAEKGEMGRIVITDLFNYAFPLIRYDTGDTCIMEYNSSGWPKIKEIFGKKMDVIYSTTGQPISPITISVYMWSVKSIKQWQFIQKEKSLYILKINGTYSMEIDNVLLEMKKVLGQDAEIKIDYVDEIPVLASNKRRKTICELQ